MSTPNADYVREVEEVAQSLDDLRERLMSAGVDDDVIDVLRSSAVAAWDAVALLNDRADG